MPIQLNDRQLHERLGAALYRLTCLEQSASESNGSKYDRKLLEGMRRLVSELELAVMEIQQAAARAAQLRGEADLAAKRTQLIFDLTPAPCLLVESSGTIVDANPAAVRLLNVSQRHLIGRPFHLFLTAERDLFLERLGRLRQASDVEPWQVTIRPRERSAVSMTLNLVSDPSTGAIVMLLPPEASRERTAPETAA
jgi:PAS domain-containing protein